MTDDEFLSAFEQGTLPAEAWTHAAHVRAGFLICREASWDIALQTIRQRIQHLNAVTNTPEAIDRGYHETITQAFLRLIFAANLRTGPYTSSAHFCEMHPELMDKKVLRQFYSREQIMTWEVKRAFVEPDLRPLPY